MCITINDIIGEARIYLSYPIKGKEIAVVNMLSNNAQIWLQKPINVLLKTGKETTQNKGMYMDKELNSLIGMKLKSQMMSSHEDVQMMNSHEKN